VSALASFGATKRVRETYRIDRIGDGRSHDCAGVHAASFAAAWDQAEIAQFLVASETIAHGAFAGVDDRLVGMVLSRVAADESEVLTLAVDPAHRRRGLARRLLATHLASLAGAGVARLFLEVGTENKAARALYAGLGFAEVGERKDYYRAAGAPPRSARVLRLDLAPHSG
jgi:ribosomal-protein-alanine N-acetyltransferase